MNRQLESAWKDLVSFITSFRFGGLDWKTAPSGYLFLPTMQVVEHFLAEHPRHKGCRANLLQELEGSARYMEKGRVRVSLTSPLAG